MKYIANLTITAFLSLMLVGISNAEDNAKLDVSGSFQSEFSYVTDRNESESDFYLSIVELSIDPSLSSNVSGHLLMLYEYGENDNEFSLDEGYIEIKMPFIESIEFSSSLGKLAIPFGEFNSHFVSDPYVLEIGETGQYALGVSLNHKIIQISSALFKDRIDVDGRNNNQINAFAVKLKGSTPEDMFGEKVNISIGGSFISNIVGTDGLSETFAEITRKVSGLNGFVSLNVMGIFLDAETLTALDNIETLKDEVQKPKSINFELGYALPGIPVEIAGKYENISFKDDDSTKRFGGVLSVGIFNDKAKLHLEFLRTDEGDTKRNSVTGQLAVEF